MKAIILAAGRGSRLKSLTSERPKCLVELYGKPLLEWQISALSDAGIEEIGIVTGYKREMLSPYELVEFHNPRWSETQMVTSLDCAAEWLERDTCIVSYSDIFYAASAVISLLNSLSDVAITFDPNWLDLWKKRFTDPLIDAETFRIDSDGVLMEIGNKPRTVDDVNGQYMGLLKITPEGWREIKSIYSGFTYLEQDKIDMTKLLQKIIDREKLPIEAIPYLDKWGEVDNVSDSAVYSK